MSGVGDVLSPPLDLPPLAAVLVNPGVAVATKEVFAALEPGALPRPAAEGPQPWENIDGDGDRLLAALAVLGQ